MNAALDFLAGDAPDHEGRTLADYLLFKPEDWEVQHDIIQWAFPTQTVSAYNPNAPVLPASFQYDVVHQQALLKLFTLYMDAINIKRSDANNGRNMVKFEYVKSALGYSLRRDDHNFKRLSRIIECFKLFGLEAFADDLAEFLIFDFAVQYHYLVDSKTVVYWVATWQNKKELLLR